jgi:hypothetical protein
VNFKDRIRFDRQEKGVRVTLIPSARGGSVLLTWDEWAEAVAAMSPWGVTDATRVVARRLVPKPETG